MNKVELIVEDISHGGHGVGRINSKVVFIKKALPGEILSVEIVEDKKDYSIANIVEIKSASKFRAKPVCKYYNLCGGCDFQHIDYLYQVELKKKILASVLRRIGNIEVDNIQVEECEHTFNYRRRVKFHCEGKKWGFFKERSNSVVTVKSCAIADNAINEYIKTKNCSKKELVVSDNGSVNAKIMFLDLSDVIPNLYLTYEYGSFVQVNRLINLKIIKAIVDNVKRCGAGSVFDFFGGIGNFSLPLAVSGIDVVSFDSNSKSVNSFNRNATRLNVSKTAKSVRKNLNRPFVYDYEGRLPRCFVLDPPRAGAKNIVNYIVENKPEYVLYISCEPSTLARDLRILNKCYTIKKVTLFDMFPQTHHFETLVNLELR